MSHYNFKRIAVVPSMNDFVDIVLSKTQRKTPTVVHRHYKISRIRQFYMRKVKFTQQNFHDKLTTILSDFPKVEEIHPFFADLLNILYDKDHYKLALGQLNTGKHLIDNVSRDYCRLLKYGDSLYRCKTLKKAALGRMANIMKRQKENLEYLEQVRQHLSRLPSLDPNSRTLLLCGFPNVGKSSFLNKVTKADVQVEPYAFTTKSLFVGHTDYQYLRWQVIDTPGILDHPLEERNVIEMQSITALAHLRACIVYIMDVSEQCGYSMDMQFKLFHEIKPLFANKPILVVANKVDIKPFSDLDPNYQEMFASLEKTDNVTVMQMSTLEEMGVAETRNAACDLLLAHRVESKEQNKKTNTILNRLYVAMPNKRDNMDRKPCIPDAVFEKRAKMEIISAKRRLERDIEEELGDDYVLDLKKNYDIPLDERHDVIPEHWNGHNIADYVQEDIEAKAMALEREEESRELEGYYDVYDSEEDDPEIKDMSRRIREKIAIMAVNKTIEETNKPKLNRLAASNRRGRSVTRLRGEMEQLEVEFDDDDLKHANEAAAPIVRSRPMKRKREDTSGRVRSSSRATPRDDAGLPDPVMKKKAKKLQTIGVRSRSLNARKGEGDRVILNVKPKHLFSGKRKMKADRR